MRFLVLGAHLVIRKNGGGQSPLRAFVGWRGGGGESNFIRLPPPLLAINNRQSVSFRQFKC